MHSPSGSRGVLAMTVTCPLGKLQRHPAGRRQSAADLEGRPRLPRCAVGPLQSIPLLPRFRDRRVLDEGIVDMPLLWQTDAFALAAAYDESADRYINMWTLDDKGAAPVATDSLLLVRPDVAAKQREAEMATSSELPGPSITAETEKRVHAEPRSHWRRPAPVEDSILRHQDTEIRQDRDRLQGCRRACCSSSCLRSAVACGSAARSCVNLASKLWRNRGACYRGVRPSGADKRVDLPTGTGPSRPCRSRRGHCSPGRTTARAPRNTCWR